MMLHTLILVVSCTCGESKCGAVLITESTAVMTNKCGAVLITEFTAVMTNDITEKTRGYFDQSTSFTEDYIIHM